LDIYKGQNTTIM